MADLERIYTVPLRNAQLAPKYRRANRAIKEIKIFMARHMKSDIDNIWLDEKVNETVWARGIEKPPRRVRVKATRFDDGLVEVALADE